MASEAIYQMVTERVVQKIQDAIKALEAGATAVIAPWRRPWFQTGIPSNLISKKAYRGFNVFFLSCLGYTSPYFVSFKQAKDMGATIKKGEHGYPVVFWKWVEVDKDDDGNALAKPKKIPFLRYFTVFNTEQTEGIDPKKIPSVEVRIFNPIAEGDAIINNMPHRPQIEHGGGRASYCPSTDIVRLPNHETFNTDGEYYSTAFHELTHSTGHVSRLNRSEVMDGISFGSHSYSREELVAEMGSVFLCNEIGLEATFDNSLAYMKSWLGKLKDDTKMLIVAAGRAQKAVDYILGNNFEDKKNDDDE